MNTSSFTDKGARVIRGLPRSLDRHDPVAIGSDPSSDIVIEGADPHHVELRWDRDEAAWYAFDDPAPSLTLRNGTPIDSTKMFEGDELEIAGVCLRFENGYLKEHRTSAKLKMLLRNVSATAGGKQLLQNISFEARPGMFVALLGPSGCGKSTLIQRIAGLAPFEGQILFNGYDLRTEVASLRPLMAYLPQAVEDTLSGDMTVCEAMDDFVRCHLPSDVRPDFTAKLADVGLDTPDIPAKPVRQLSGGQKRRLALALALLREPQLLLLDEPTAGLDPAAEEGVMALLRRIADQGRTVLCATHVLGSLGMCDEVLVLAPGGRQSFVGTPARALDFFGTSDWRDIYRMLQEGIAPAQMPCEFSVNASGDEELTPALAGASIGRAFCAVLRRLVRAVMLSWKNAAFVFGNPIVIASVLLMACWSMFERGNLGTIYFCMVVAMFWLGLSGAVRNLVAERIPKRCLDRMRGMPLAPYFGAHTAFVLLSVALQSFLFVLPVFLIKLGVGNFSMHALLPFWFILTFVGFSGACVGLFVSAFAKREIQAVWALPFVAILALFLSKPVLEGGNGEKPVGFLRVVECAMPTHAPQTLLETTMDRARGFPISNEIHAANRRDFVTIATAYPVVFLALAFLFQVKREKEWDGR